MEEVRKAIRCANIHYLQNEVGDEFKTTRTNVIDAFDTGCIETLQIIWDHYPGAVNKDLSTDDGMEEVFKIVKGWSFYPIETHMRIFAWGN